MTAERYRVPAIQATQAAGHLYDAGASTDLFALASPSIPHPDFAARAAIWRDQRAGLISLAEASRRSAAISEPQPAPRRGRIGHNAAPHPPRHLRPAPQESRQYAPALATTAMRDDRLTPNAKALLAVLRARVGKGRVTRMAKGTLAAIMSRSARTIARYLRDLEAFGYITTEIHRNGRGLHLGLVVTLTERVMPFFEDAKALAGWLVETPAALAAAFTGRVLTGKPRATLLTPKNQSLRKSLLSEVKSRLLREGRGGRPVPS